MNSRENAYFILDIDNIIDFVFDDENERDSDSEITETYVADDEENKIELVNKQVREVKSRKDNSSKETIKYDLIKTFLTILNESDYNESGSFSLSESIIFNTMLTKNLIKKVEE